MDLWEDVWCNKVAGDKGPKIFDYELFVPASKIIAVWDIIKYLTMKSQPRHHSAEFPDSMEYEAHKGHYTIILETPKERQDKVLDVLKEHKLDEFIRLRRPTPVTVSKYCIRGFISRLKSNYLKTPN